MSLVDPQRGSTLLVALIMLVLLTLIAVSAINSSTTSVQIVGNAQFRQEAAAAAQQAIENAISNNNFQSALPASQNIDINNDGTKDYTVTFSPAPKCISYRPVASTDANVPTQCADSSLNVAVCYWTTWDVAATVSDAQTSASLVVHQGVQAISGLDAALVSCI